MAPSATTARRAWTTTASGARYLLSPERDSSQHPALWQQDTGFVDRQTCLLLPKLPNLLICSCGFAAHRTLSSLRNLEQLHIGIVKHVSNFADGLVS